MKRTPILVLILFIVIAAVAAPLPLPAVAEFLTLSGAQTAQIQSLPETLQSAIEPLREQQRANRETLEAALDAGDTAKAGQLAMGWSYRRLRNFRSRTSNGRSKSADSGIRMRAMKQASTIAGDELDSLFRSVASSHFQRSVERSFAGLI